MNTKFEFSLSDIDASNLMDILRQEVFRTEDARFNFVGKNDPVSKANLCAYDEEIEYLNALCEKIARSTTRTSNTETPVSFSFVLDEAKTKKLNSIMKCELIRLDVQRMRYIDRTDATAMANSDWYARHMDYVEQLSNKIIMAAEAI